MKTKELKFDMYGLELTAKVAPEDYEWVKLLFTRNNKPFKALKDLGYVVDNKT